MLMFTEQNLQVTHSPSSSVGSYAVLTKPTFPVGATLGALGMGWALSTYRDEFTLMHGGAVFGYSALVTLVPSRNIGIVLLFNQNEVPFQDQLITWLALDFVIGYEPWLNVSNSCNFPCDFVQCEDEKVKKESPLPFEYFTKQSIETSEYVGSYQHPGNFYSKN